jgi:hypothetical protein
MATLDELAGRLVRRFKGVPGVTYEDAYDWIDESLLAHGLQSPTDVTGSQAELVLLYAQANGAFQISLATAHYFSYTDGDEQVDKTAVSEQYRKLATDLRAEYELKKAAETSGTMRFMKRADRP